LLIGVEKKKKGGFTAGTKEERRGKEKQGKKGRNRFPLSKTGGENKLGDGKGKGTGSLVGGTKWPGKQSNAKGEG